MSAGTDAHTVGEAAGHQRPRALEPGEATRLGFYHDMFQLRRFEQQKAAEDE